MALFFLAPHTAPEGASLPNKAIVSPTGTKGRAVGSAGLRNPTEPGESNSRAAESNSRAAESDSSPPAQLHEFRFLRPRIARILRIFLVCKEFLEHRRCLEFCEFILALCCPRNQLGRSGFCAFRGRINNCSVGEIVTLSHCHSKPILSRQHAEGRTEYDNNKININIY